MKHHAILILWPSFVVGGAAPEALFVHLAHATRAGHDQRLRRAPAADGSYQGGLPPRAPGRASRGGYA